MISELETLRLFVQTWRRLGLNLNEVFRKGQLDNFLINLGFEHLISPLYMRVICTSPLLLRAIKKHESYLYSGSNQACTEKQNRFYDK